MRKYAAAKHSGNKTRRLVVETLEDRSLLSAGSLLAEPAALLPATLERGSPPKVGQLPAAQVIDQALTTPLPTGVMPPPLAPGTTTQHAPQAEPMALSPQSKPLAQNPPPLQQPPPLAPTHQTSKPQASAVVYHTVVLTPTTVLYVYVRPTGLRHFFHQIWKLVYNPNHTGAGQYPGGFNPGDGAGSPEPEQPPPLAYPPMPGPEDEGDPEFSDPDGGMGGGYQPEPPDPDHRGKIDGYTPEDVGSGGQSENAAPPLLLGNTAESTGPSSVPVPVFDPIEAETSTESAAQLGTAVLANSGDVDSHGGPTDANYAVEAITYVGLLEPPTEPLSPTYTSVTPPIPSGSRGDPPPPPRPVETRQAPAGMGTKETSEESRPASQPDFILSDLALDEVVQKVLQELEEKILDDPAWPAAWKVLPVFVSLVALAGAYEIFRPRFKPSVFQAALENAEGIRFTWFPGGDDPWSGEEL